MLRPPILRGAMKLAQSDSDWLTREKLLTLALLAVTVLLVYVCWLIVAPFFPALSWALALAIIAHPIHGWVARRIKNPAAASLISVAIVVLIVIGPVILVAQQVAGEASNKIRGVQEQAESGAWKEALTRDPRLASLIGWVQERFNIDQEIARITRSIADRAAGWLTGTAWALLQLAVTLFTLFYFFRDRKMILRGVRSMAPLSTGEADRVFRRIAETIYASIYGSVGTSLIQGTLGGLMFWWLGMPTPLLWGFAMFLVSLVPTLGAPIIWVPAAIVLLVQGSWVKGLILAVWGVLVVGSIDNVLYPILVGSRLRMHALPIFFAVVGGLFAFGPSGLVLGPTALAVLMALFHIWHNRTEGDQSAEEALDLGKDRAKDMNPATR